MTHPFHSIISTPQPPEGDPAGQQDDHDTRNDFKEALTEDLRAEELAAISISPEEQPDGLSDLPALIETGLANLHKTMQTADARALPPQRKPLCGGEYTKTDALALLNSHFFIGKNNKETGIFRINEDGSATFVPPEQFKLEIQNIFVKGSPKKPAEKFWRENSQRHERIIVFKPGGTVEPHEFNLWRDFGVKPCKGWQKQRRLLRHILKIICQCDKAKFKYLMRWLAWAVQNPDKQAAVVIVLKSRKQGTGKSTLGVVMLKIFGHRHGALIDDSDRLLGRFNDWVEPMSFILGEEILWAGNHKTADQLKSRITADTFQIERKGGAVLQIPNRLHIIMTTNHDHAVGAGVGDRRFVVLEVSDERACDKSWFDPIYRDLDAGGASEFLYLLQNVKLGDWHPRQILKTEEASEQQRMSGDTISHWAQACVEADAVIGTRGSHGNEVSHDLNTIVSATALQHAYTGFCNQNGLRPLNTTSFGKACREMFGQRKRLSPDPLNKNKRPWGYDVPDGDTWQRKIDDRLGIKK